MNGKGGVCRSFYGRFPKGDGLPDAPKRRERPVFDAASFFSVWISQVIKEYLLRIARGGIAAALQRPLFGRRHFCFLRLRAFFKYFFKRKVLMSQQENLTATQEVRPVPRPQTKGCRGKGRQGGGFGKKASEPGKRGERAEACCGEAGEEAGGCEKARGTDGREAGAQTAGQTAQGKGSGYGNADGSADRGTNGGTKRQCRLKTGAGENGARAGEIAVREPESSVSGAEGGERPMNRKCSRAAAQDDAEVRLTGGPAHIL